MAGATSVHKVPGLELIFPAVFAVFLVAFRCLEND